MTNLCVKNDRRVRRIGWLLLFMFTAFSVASVKHERELTLITRELDPKHVGSWRHEMSECAVLVQGKLDAILGAVEVSEWPTTAMECTPLMSAAKTTEEVR